MWTPETVSTFWQGSEASFAGEVKASQVLGLTRRYVKGRVLDVGAGSGALLDLLPESIGVDLVPRHPRVCQGSAENLPFSDGQFDTVFAVDVLEHVTDLHSSLNEIVRVLRAGGHFILVVPNDENLDQEVVTCPMCRAKFHRWGHLRRFSYREVKDLLSHYGLRVLTHGVFPLSLMSEHWLIRRFWRLFLAAKWVKPTDLLMVTRKC